MSSMISIRCPRSSCPAKIAPFAWSRMTSSIKVDSPKQEARVAKLREMVPEKIAPEPLDIEPVAPVQEAPPQYAVVKQQPMIVMRQGAQVIMVPVPFNAMPGSMLQIIHPQTGQPMYVTVPQNAMPGQCFPVQIQVTQAVRVGGPSAPDAEVMHKDD